MPSRGSYQIAPGVDAKPPPAAPAPAPKASADPEKGQLTRPDTSFRDCVLSLLLVLLIIAILVLVTRPWGGVEHDAAHGSAQAHGGHSGSRTTPAKTTTPFQTWPKEKPVVATTRSTPNASTATSEPVPVDEYDEYSNGDANNTTSANATKPEAQYPSGEAEEEQIERHPKENPVADSDEVNSGDANNTISASETTTEVEQSTTPPAQAEASSVDDPTTPATDEQTDQEGVTDVATTRNDQQRSAKLLVAVTTMPATPTDMETDQEVVTDTALTRQDQQRSAKLLTLVAEESIENTSVVPNPKPALCESAACKKQAARMLGMMDHSTEPCQDFYQFACGGLRDSALLAEADADAEARARIEGEMARLGSGGDGAALRTFRRFYDLCVEDIGDKDKRVKRLATSTRNAIAKIGQLHTKATWDADKFDLTDLLTKLLLQHSSPLLDVTLDVSAEASDRFALKLTPPVMPPLLRVGPARPECEHVAVDETDLNLGYSDYLNCTSNHSRYMTEVEAAVRTLGLFSQLTEAELVQNVNEIRTSIEWDVWDTELLKVLPAEGEKLRQLLAKEYEQKTVRELQDDYRMVDWRRLLSGLLRINPTELPDSTEVQVYFKPYLDRLFENLQTQNTRTLQNALLAMYARDLYVHALVSGPRCQRQTRCLRVASALMEDVASSLYLASFNTSELDAMEEQSEAVFQELRATLQTQLQHADWLDAGSRSDAVDKLQRMRIDASGGRALFTDSAQLDARMTGIDLAECDDVVKLSVALTARYRRLMYALHDKNPNSTEAGWTHFLLPYSTSPISVYGLNSVMVPFGLLTWPLLDSAVPRHVTLARLGFVIAHEMAHHFDSVGIRYRAGGGRGESVLMKGRASRAYDFYQEVQCPVYARYNYYASHTEPDGTVVKFNLDGALLARNERLADDAASALSLDAAERWQRETAPDQTLPFLGLTSQQEHFLAVAQMFCQKEGVSSWRLTLFKTEHPPAPLRVNDLATNSAAFASAFACPPGQDMSPAVRCDAFPALAADDADDTEASYDNIPPAS